MSKLVAFSFFDESIWRTTLVFKDITPFFLPKLNTLKSLT